MQSPEKWSSRLDLDWVVGCGGCIVSILDHKVQIVSIFWSVSCSPVSDGDQRITLMQNVARLLTFKLKGNFILKKSTKWQMDFKISYFD